MTARAIAADPRAWPSPAYGWYVVAVLAATYMMAYVDRVVLGLLAEELRRAFQVSDTQIGLLGGAAFAFFYVAMGLPLGRLADRANRRNMITVSTLLWSVMTCVCGLASSFGGLFLARIGVGVGEAALSPAAQSMIGDHFPPARRGAPLAAYMLAIAIGSGLAYVAGGALIDWAKARPDLQFPLVGTLAPWQLVFIAVGAPALLLVPLLASLREPLRRGRMQAVHGARALSIAEVAQFILVRNGRTFAPVFLGFAGLALHSIALQIWLPAHFIRSFGWSEGRIGIAYGLIVLVFATLGMLGGGYIAQTAARARSSVALLWVPLWMSVLMTPLAIVLPLMQDATLALCLLAPVTALSFGVFAVIPGILQSVTPNEMRGQVAALFAFVNNIIGMVLGGALVGVFTDYLFRDPAKVGWSLALTGALVLPLSILCLWLAVAPFRASLDRARAWEARDAAFT